MCEGNTHRRTEIHRIMNSFFIEFLISLTMKNTHHEKCFESHEYIFEGVPHIGEEEDEDLVVDVHVPSLHFVFGSIRYCTLCQKVK